MTPTRVYVALIAAAAFLLGGVLGWVANDANQLTCATEDSCVADYHDGSWHIEPVTHAIAP